MEGQGKAERRGKDGEGQGKAGKRSGSPREGRQRAGAGQENTAAAPPIAAPASDCATNAAYRASRSPCSA